MDLENAHPPESRPPTVRDLVVVCRSLNERRARYLVVGGFAVNQHGFSRATMDIDLLVEDSLENQVKVKQALEVLPDKAVRELGDDDLRNYSPSSSQSMGRHDGAAASWTVTRHSSRASHNGPPVSP